MKRLILCWFLFAGSITAQTLMDNTKLTELYTVDQSAREAKNIDWSRLSAEDEQRRSEVRRMLDTGEVRTGADYLHAAMVYQHGQSPDDYLLAHVLAMDAISLGNKDARWLAAATLDRYLRSIWQPQIYGTQFASPAGQPVTQHQTMHPSMVSDSMRAAVCVAPLAEQQKILEDVRKGGKFRSTRIENCK